MKQYNLKICDICLRSEIYPLIDNSQGKLLVIKREPTDLDALMLCEECRDAEKLRVKRAGGLTKDSGKFISEKGDSQWQN